MKNFAILLQKLEKHMMLGSEEKTHLQKNLLT